jgi:hypothetical protein
MTELYLRDLNIDFQQEFLTWFKRTERKDLLIAYDNNRKIIIGSVFNKIRDIKTG